METLGVQDLWLELTQHDPNTLPIINGARGATSTRIPVPSLVEIFVKGRIRGCKTPLRPLLQEGSRRLLLHMGKMQKIKCLSIMIHVFLGFLRCFCTG